jgi:hypothetical protein
LSIKQKDYQAKFWPNSQCITNITAYVALSQMKQLTYLHIESVKVCLSTITQITQISTKIFFCLNSLRMNVKRIWLKCWKIVGWTLPKKKPHYKKNNMEIILKY